MKSFLACLFGIAVGAVAYHFYTEESLTPAPEERASSLADQARQAAGNAREAVSSKLEEWKLTPDEIRRDLSETGQVVRSKARSAGERIDDARIVTVIKAKLVLDRELSALAINVDSKDGHVTLTGKVNSPEHIARAMALVLDTDGVVHATAQLTVAPN